MTPKQLRDWTILIRMEGYDYRKPSISDIEEQLHAHADALEELARLRARLEIDFAIDGNGKRVPFPEGAPDGIACRDETIRLLEAALAERDAEIAGLKEDAADSTAAYGLLFKSHGRLRDHSEALREAGQQLTSDCRDKDWLRDWDRAVSAYRAEFGE